MNSQTCNHNITLRDHITPCLLDHGHWTSHKGTDRHGLPVLWNDGHHWGNEDDTGWLRDGAIRAAKECWECKR